MDSLLPSEFPTLLREMPDSPQRLFYKGDVRCLREGLPVALVGTRRPSGYGLRAAHHFARELVAAGVTLVSGLARGIDSIAHQAAVLAGRPTVAVVGHGLDQIYPSQNRGLAQQIVSAGGCLVSEYPPGVPPQPFHFPRRNRILSGLCHGTVVVEAGAQSGSLITARHALDQNREVFVVPGPFFESGFAGSHWLLQQGAKLVVRVDEILEELTPGVLPLPKVDRDPGSGFLRECLRTRGVVSLEEIAAETGEDLCQIRQAIESARQAGWVVETSPHCFVYAGK